MAATISGPDVSHYKYVIGTGSLDCSAATYGSETAIGTSITDDIEAMADGTIKICVITKSAGGTFATRFGAIAEKPKGGQLYAPPPTGWKVKEYLSSFSKVLALQWEYSVHCNIAVSMNEVTCYLP